MQMPVQAVQSASERRDRDAFLAMMWAFSYPGRVQHLSEPSANLHETLIMLGTALLDLEVSFYASNDALETHLSKTGARHAALAGSDYVFFERLDAGDMALLDELQIGTFEYPDRGATLLIGCEIGSSSQGDACWRLNGPGINGEQRMQIRGVPEDFFTRRQRRMHYPLGFDTVFVSAGAVIGLPRTTGVTRCT